MIISSGGSMNNNSGLKKYEKLIHMERLADYRDNTLRPSPELRNLFIEMTSLCNEHCRHCGSSCGDFTDENPLSGDEIKAFLRQIKNDFPIDRLKLSITGGEPLLRKDFFDIMGYAKGLGYSWGMTSNGTLITPSVAQLLYETGMKTISVSIDGLRETHEWFRQTPGCYDKTVSGIKNLLDTGGFQHVQVTTVVHGKNINELDELYEIMLGLGVRSWRVINIEPIGRAKQQPELLLDAKQLKYMFDFIREKRFLNKMEVIYGCSHYLGADYEREVRKWYFLCNSGVYTASVASNGDILGCLDTERRPELVQGNIRTDNFREVWLNRFECYRGDYRKTGKCKDCKHYIFCAGDSFHTWDFDRMEPALCLKGILF